MLADAAAAYAVYSLPTLGAFPPPFTAELGFTRVRPPINWPKSDKSDFGWRDRKEACNKAHACKPTPSPTLPRKRERERTEIAAPSAGYSLHGIPWSARPRESGTRESGFPLARE